MTVRFKFRSSVDFDSVDLGGRPSISVRELRVKIVEKKKLQICRDFDLVISDAVTGEAYEDEEFPILEGSSVIIKRVPAGRSAPADLVANGATGNSATKHNGFIDTMVSSPLQNVDMENFDDFGIDLYPDFGTSLVELDTDVGNMDCAANRKADAIPRCSETSIMRGQNFERSDLIEAMPKGNSGDKCNMYIEENKERSKFKYNKDQPKKMDEDVGMPSPPMLNADLPTELRCSLCNTIFKEAVMIPCCQHSFCDKCIHLELVERARCPKCSSKKCTVQDLLPNLSLRQAIEHFLEAQVPINGSDKIISKYVPDGESGIQAKEVSCAVSIHQREPPLPHSPSATGKGSNLVMTESAYDSLMKNKRNAGTSSRINHIDADKSVKSASTLLKIKQIKRDDKGSAEDVKKVADYQSGSSLKLPQNLLQKEEGNLAIPKRKGFGINIPDGTGGLMPPSKHRKGDRNCYMCGSPNHLVRDCPAASNSYPILQTGDTAFAGGMPAYGPPYWHGSSIPQVRPYANLYATPGMMPFDPRVLPVTPMGIQSYMPSFYAGMPLPYGFMRMGGAPPHMVVGAERPVSRAEYMDLQDAEHKHRLSNEHPEREPGYDDLTEDCHYGEPRRRSHEWRPQLDKGTSRACSDSDSQRIRKKHSHDKHVYSPSHQRADFTSDDEEILSVDWKHEKGSHVSVSGRDQRTHYSEKSSSEIQDASDSSTRHNRERNSHYHTSCSKKHGERREQCGSDCSRRSHHRSRKEKYDDREKVVTEHKRHNRTHHNHPESGLEPDSSSDRRQRRKDKELSHTSKLSRQKVKAAEDQLEDDRWEMVDGLDEDYKGEYHYHKRKRTC